MSDLLAINGNVIGGLPIASENLKLLWENPSPTSEFAAQNITLASDDYDLLIWIVRNSTNDSYDFSNISQKSDSCILSTTTWDGKSIYRSSAYISNTSFYIDNCTYDGSLSANNLCIPIAIYGIYKKSIANTEASKCMMTDGVTSVETVLLGFSGRIDNLDAFTLIYRGVAEDLNTALDHGFYAISGTAANLPAAEFAFGNLVVLGGYYKTQIAFSVESTQRMAIRKSVSDTWRII